MSSLTLAEAGPRTADSESRTTASTATPHPLVQGVASGLLLWFAFPPADWGWLGWIALVPLFHLVVAPGRWLTRYGGAWAGGFVFWVLAIQWVRLTDPGAWLAWLAMALVLSLGWPLFLGLTRLAVVRLGVPLILAAPVLWVALEYLRAYFLTGFPWYYLAHSQHNALPLIQIADFAGALGLSFVMAMVNAACVELLILGREVLERPRWPRFFPLLIAVTCLLVASTLGYGSYRLASARFRPGPRLALIQTNLIQRYKMNGKASELLPIYERLVARAAHAVERPDLIIWPETSYPYGFVAIDPALAHDRFLQQAHQLSAQLSPEDWVNTMTWVSRHLHGLTDQLRVPQLVGTLTYDFRPSGPSKYNSAILFEPGKSSTQSYHKLHLVPFGEYVPLIETFPWLTAFTPYHGPDAVVPSLTFGSAPSWFQLGPYRFAAAICFEDTVPQVVRRFFAAPPGGPPDVLLNLSNDGWFHGSSEHDMHLVVSTFRAVENRVPLARTVNTGISAVIDGNGRVLASLPKLTEGVLAQTVPLDDRVSLYSTWGDWVGLLCLAAMALSLIGAALQTVWRRTPSRSAATASA